MVWLHENREEFKNAVLFTADQNRITPAAVEKDYYVMAIEAANPNISEFDKTVSMLENMR